MSAYLTVLSTVNCCSIVLSRFSRETVDGGEDFLAHCVGLFVGLSGLPVYAVNTDDTFDYILSNFDILRPSANNLIRST